MKELDTIKINIPFKGMIAHRGTSKVKIENTISSFLFASKKTYYGMECDIHRTKDNKYVVSHDASLKRVFNLDFNVHEHTLDEIKNLNLDIPTLEEYIDICKSGSKVAVVELKETITYDDIDNVIDIIKNKEMLDNTIFISFYPGYLVKIRKRLKNQRIQFLTAEMSDTILDFCTIYNLSLDVGASFVRKEMVDKFHQNGLLVNVYTVDDLDECKKLIDYGVDYITSNILE